MACPTKYGRGYEQGCKRQKGYIRELSSSANKLCHTTNFHVSNIKNISDAECQRMIEYITGLKADGAKHKNQDIIGTSYLETIIL